MTRRRPYLYLLRPEDLLLAVLMVASAADLHHVDFGRVLTFLAAILAVLRRRATARLARAGVVPRFVSHLELTSSSGSSFVGEFVST